MHIHIVLGDITKQKDVEAIVNAAKPSLLGGGGVDGAIHRAAGPNLLEECKTLGGCETGEAKLTKGYKLPCKFVIHTVGPIYKDGQHHEPELLKLAYENSLKLAAEHLIQSVAFPCISTGIYGYPIEEATRIAIKTVVDFQKNSKNSFDFVRFVVFSESDLKTYQEVIAEYTLTKNKKVSLIKELFEKPGDVKDYSDLLENLDDMKTNYGDYMITEPINCDLELERIDGADYELATALLTMLLREDYWINGVFERRQKDGHVQKILQRMLETLEGTEVLS